MHRGFNEAGKQVDSDLTQKLVRWKRQGLDVYAIGHSQGAALAYRYGLLNFHDIAGVYMIAPPRLGCKQLNRVARSLDMYVVGVGSFFDSVTWTPPWPLFRHHENIIYLDVTRRRVTEIAGLREGWAVILRWYYMIFYTTYLAGTLLLNMYWELPSWFRRVSNLWSSHNAARHYAAQLRRLVTEAHRSGGYQLARLKKSRPKDPSGSAP